MPVVNLAKELRVSRATVQNRISKLEREGIILGYTVKLKENAYQNVVKVIMSISVVAKDENKVLEQLHRFPEILSLHHTNGHWDLIAEIQAENLTLLGSLLGRIRSIEGIVQTEANLLLGFYFF